MPKICAVCASPALRTLCVSCTVKADPIDVDNGEEGMIELEMRIAEELWVDEPFEYDEIYM